MSENYTSPDVTFHIYPMCRTYRNFSNALRKMQDLADMHGEMAFLVETKFGCLEEKTEYSLRLQSEMPKRYHHRLGGRYAAGPCGEFHESIIYSASPTVLKKFYE